MMRYVCMEGEAKYSMGWFNKINIDFDRPIMNLGLIRLNWVYYYILICVIITLQHERNSAIIAGHLECFAGQWCYFKERLRKHPR